MEFLYGPLTSPKSIKEINKSLKETVETSLTAQFYAKSGTHFRCNLIVAPVRDDLGNVRLFVLSLRAENEEKKSFKFAGLRLSLSNDDDDGDGSGTQTWIRSFAKFVQTGALFTIGEKEEEAVSGAAAQVASSVVADEDAPNKKQKVSGFFGQYRQNVNSSKQPHQATPLSLTDTVGSETKKSFTDAARKRRHHDVTGAEDNRSLLTLTPSLNEEINLLSDSRRFELAESDGSSNGDKKSSRESSLLSTEMDDAQSPFFKKPDQVDSSARLTQNQSPHDDVAGPSRKFAQSRPEKRDRLEPNKAALEQGKCYLYIN
ncbi:Potassium voltage-gated channel subfamily H member 7 [Cichlidogyrus casuarinus]|uniref:Potassium voltage-gated channel subfamily H member 7 n=1 Tax=Cichlidogyrus casuarinus TaxID=1844966 RepID=A0ABD2Q6Q0_9PLAT